MHGISCFIKTVIITGCTVFLSQCSDPPSGLPEVMPGDIEMTYDMNGDRFEPQVSISIKNDSLFYVERKTREGAEVRWQVAVTKTEVANIYQLFRDNRIDLIKKSNVKPMVIWEGAASQDLYLRFADKNFQVSYGANTPLGTPEARSLLAVAEGVEALKKKYEVAR